MNFKTEQTEKGTEMKSRRFVLNLVTLALLAIGALLVWPLLVVGGALCLVGVEKSHGGIWRRNRGKEAK